jgi:Ca2+-binding RTX toxin-like protein
MRAGVAGLVVTLLLVGLAFAPSSLAFHAGTSSCTYSAGVVRLRLASQHVVQLLAVEGRIEYADLTDYSFKGQCGSATVANTDAVRLSETVAGTTRFQLRQQLGRLGPGRTRETTGVSEIEVYLGTVTDIWLLGRPVRDAVTIGAGGLNLNGDGDVDLVGSHLTEITAFLEEGNDSLTAEGGRGTGSPWLPPAGGYLSAYGGDGADLLRGSGGNDTLDGDWDDDRVYGLGGRDNLRGSTGHDFVSGGSGADYIDPGYGYDTVFAGPGNDFIAAADYTADTVDGGNGSDSAFADREDQVTNVESVSPGP